jgi:hypothetical protein
MDTPAWRALSHGARSLFVALKGKVYYRDSRINGRIWLSQRDARKQLNSSTNSIARWYRELQHYGFIVQTRGGSLGVDGKGRAPHWRLTELDTPFLQEPATKDYLKWNGVKFAPRPSTFSAAQQPSRSKTKSRNGKPLRGVTENRDITDERKTVTPTGTSVTENRDIGEAKSKTENRDVIRDTISLTSPNADLGTGGLKGADRSVTDSERSTRIADRSVTDSERSTRTADRSVTDSERSATPGNISRRHLSSDALARRPSGKRRRLVVQ